MNFTVPSIFNVRHESQDELYIEPRNEKLCRARDLKASARLKELGPMKIKPTFPIPTMKIRQIEY